MLSPRRWIASLSLLNSPCLPSLLLAVSLLASASVSLGAETEQASRRPNLIFLLTDDHRWDLLGINGNEQIETPNLDQLANDGVIFDRAYVTSAICTPSRVCYFLGQYERRHGVNFNSGTALAAEAWAKSYPVLLRESGYYTGYIGKNHVPVGKQGYDTGLMDKSFDVWYAGHGHIMFYPKERHDIFKPSTPDTQIEIMAEGSLKFLDQQSDGLTEAESFLEARPKDQPFCLSLAFNLPHGASTSTMEMRPSDDELYKTAYRDQIEKLSFPETYLPRAEIEEPKIPGDVAYPEKRQKIYDWIDQPSTWRERVVRQYQTVTGIDRLVGALRAKLDQLGIAENTVIVFGSDHGLLFGEFGLGGKALNYEPCLHIPMMVMDPRQPAENRGKRSQELVMSIDVAPTLLELGEVAIPDTVQGKSLVPLIKGDNVDWRSHAFAENLWSTIFGNPRIESVTGKRFKYLRYFANDRSLFEGIGPKDVYKTNPKLMAAYAGWLNSSVLGEEPDYEELFDLKNDPHETTNLADLPEHAHRLAKLRAKCQEMVTTARGDKNTPPATVPLPSK